MIEKEHKDKAEHNAFLNMGHVLLLYFFLYNSHSHALYVYIIVYIYYFVVIPFLGFEWGDVSSPIRLPLSNNNLTHTYIY